MYLLEGIVIYKNIYYWQNLIVLVTIVKNPIWHNDQYNTIQIFKWLNIKDIATNFIPFNLIAKNYSNTNTQWSFYFFIFIFGKGLIEQKKSIQLYTDTKILHIELASYWLTPSTSLQTQGVLHFRYKDKKSVLYIGDEWWSKIIKSTMRKVTLNL